MKILNFTIISALFLAGLYLGIGGMGNVEYNTKLKLLSELKPEIDDTIPQVLGGIEYASMLELRKGEVASQQRKFLEFYPWMESVPDLISLLFTCCGFSMLGSYIFLIRETVKDKKGNTKQMQIVFLFSGFLTGLLVLGLSYVLPIILVRDGEQIRPITLMFFSLFAGMYSNKFYNKLSLYSEKFFGEN